MTSTLKRIYNVKIERLPISSLKFKTFEKVVTLPSSVDLRPKCPPVYDQGQLGSCTANALAAAFEIDDNNAFIPSRLFIYYNERKLENTIPEDAGAMLHDGIKTLQTYGVCPETLWPYDISKFAVKPSANCYTTALNTKAFTCNNIIQDLTHMKTSLANGFPFVVGIAVYESFESQQVAQTGVVHMPNLATEKCLGGHALLCVGYNDSTKTWLMRNSWGTGWGMGGYFTLPYLYLLDSHLSSDLWNITKLLIKTNTKAEKPNESQLSQLKLQLDRIETQLKNFKEQINKFEA